jgi:2-(1,2-epoxy-1,2-dihydrophenyl)acetyl-CoA isomerase
MRSMDTDLLRRLDDDGVLTLTVNRPDKRNALSKPMERLLRERTQEAALDPEVRVVILTGAGAAFCSGGDMASFGQADPSDAMGSKYAADPVWLDVELRTERLLRVVDASLNLHRMGKPTIAMIRGAAAGAGLSLAAACDFRIASENAVFTTAFAKIGASGDYAGSYFITKLVGPVKAKQLYFFSDKLDAQEALAIGLVDRVVPDDRLEAETLAFAQKLAAGPPVAFRLMKQNINAALTERAEDVVALEARNMIRSLATEDSKEAIRAFFEKREASFKGR